MPLLQGWSRFCNFFLNISFLITRGFGPKFRTPTVRNYLTIFPVVVTKCEMSPGPCKHKITNHIDNTQGRYRIYRYRDTQEIHRFKV